MIRHETLILGQLDTNCYLVWDEETKEGMVIDPADDGVAISDEVQNKGIKIKGVLLTHGHFDHALAALDIKLIFNCPIYMNSKDMFLLDRQEDTSTHFLKRKIGTPNIIKIDYDLEKIKKIELGKEILEVIKTPGHTPGSVCFFNLPHPLFHKRGVKPILFSGDTLFKECRGRTDFEYGSTEKIFKSLKKLMKLSEDTVVLSGHGEETTIGTEKERYVFD